MGSGNAHGLPFLCLWLGIEVSQITRKIEVDESIIKMTLKDGNRYATNQYHGRVKIEWLAITTKRSSTTCCYELYKRQTTYGGTWILLFNIQQVLKLMSYCSTRSDGVYRSFRFFNQLCFSITFYLSYYQRLLPSQPMSQWRHLCPGSKRIWLSLWYTVYWSSLRRWGAGVYGFVWIWNLLIRFILN